MTKHFCRQLNDEAAFTVIELLTVMAVISVLAAIAIVQYSAYRAVAYDREAQVIARAVAAAQEAYFLDHDGYVACNQSDCAAVLPAMPPIKENIVLEVVLTPSGYQATARHLSGTGKEFTLGG